MMRRSVITIAVIGLLCVHTLLASEDKEKNLKGLENGIAYEKVCLPAVLIVKCVVLLLKREVAVCTCSNVSLTT